MKHLTQADFDPLLNEPFKLEFEGQQVELVLTEVNPGSERIRSQYGPEERAPFSLVFKGPAQPQLAQMVYWLEHPSLGKQGIFLVPLGPDQDGMCYEAVFA